MSDPRIDSPPLFDSHAHLSSFDEFREDLPSVLDAARAAGVVGLIDIGAGGSAKSFERSLAFANRFDWVWATAGVHPHEAKHGSPEVLERLEDIAKEEKIVAIGETGLDYHYDLSPRDVQRDVFAKQLRIAHAVELPFIVHTREADEDTLTILRDEGAREASGVIHCFSGGPSFAQSMIELDLHVSFSGIVTFKTAENVREAAKLVPDHKLLIETDSPFLAPVPHRGKRNEPAFVARVAETLAEIRGVTVADIARITTMNTRRLFSLPSVEEAPIVYPIRDQLYVNASNRCSLACIFCPKRRDWTVKGHMLRHEREPSEAEVKAAVWGADPEKYREVVFCGLGESTLRYDLVLDLGKALKAKGCKTRLDTDGLASLREGRDVTGELAEAFDAVSVSLNAADGETYQHLCPSKFGEKAWESSVEFLRSARGKFSRIIASVVSHPDLEIEPARKLVEDELGIEFRVRKYNEVG